MEELCAYLPTHCSKLTDWEEAEYALSHADLPKPRSPVHINISANISEQIFPNLFIG